jgi:hypothetical protein
MTTPANKPFRVSKQSNENYADFIPNTVCEALKFGVVENENGK